jgi:hypothetical protein
MTDWAAWGTSVGTLVLAGATFAAIRSSNRSARIAERSLLAGLQPLLVVARRDDPPEEVQFADGRIFKAGRGSVLFHHEVDVIYMALPLRNAGAGIAYLYGYRIEAEPAEEVDAGTLDAAPQTRRRCPGHLELHRPTARPVRRAWREQAWRSDVAHHWRGTAVKPLRD